MNCLETQKRMRSFLDGTLPDKELKEFTGHVETCPDCREELEIYYLFDQSLNIKDEETPGHWTGEKDAVDGLLRAAARKAHMYQLFRRIRIAVRFCGIMILLSGLFWASGLFTIPEKWMSNNPLKHLLQKKETYVVQTEESEAEESERISEGISETGEETGGDRK